jgi:hypothetical protein
VRSIYILHALRQSAGDWPRFWMGHRMPPVMALAPVPLPPSPPVAAEALTSPRRSARSRSAVRPHRE